MALELLCYDPTFVSLNLSYNSVECFGEGFCKMAYEKQLHAARQLIAKGEKSQAVSILRQVCRQDPKNEEAWWLAAQAFTEPERIKMALERVLYFDPFHDEAEKMLARLNNGQLTQAPSVKNGSSNNTVIWLALIVLIIAVGGGGAALVLMGGAEDSVASEIQLPTQHENAQQASSQGETITPAPPTATNTLRPTRDFITWTPSATFAPATRVASDATPWYATSAPAETIDPALFGDTYWTGLGDGDTMDQYTRGGGRYLRFFEFPINVYLDAPEDVVWQRSLDSAIGQLSPYISIQQVFIETEATMSVIVLPPSDYERWSGCPAQHTAGCASIINFGDFAGGDSEHRIYGQVWVATDSYNPVGVLLHEMLHALGIVVHSPNRNDIMYPVITNRTTLSQRDINTLMRLYANPSYDD